MPASIEVTHLTKKYGALTAVDDISFSVERGETFGMLGPNGAGKTTTLEMIEGLKRPTSGEIRLEGLDVRKQTEAVKAIIGVQLQASTFFENLSLVELIKVFASCYNRKVDAMQLLGEVQLTEKAGSKAKELSGGQKQRLSIAIGLVNDPQVLFLDEPTTGLDPQARRNLWELVKLIKSRSKTIVLTTHYMDEAEVLCDRIAIMDHAKIVALDTTAGLLAKTNVGARIEFTARLAPADEALRGLAGVVGLDRAEETYSVITSDSQATLDALFALARGGTLRMETLNVRRTTLEDVFLKLTGHQLREQADMYCTYTLTIASMKMFLRNRQALFFSLFMPLMILFIFGSIDFDKPPEMKIGVVTHHPSLATSQFLTGIHSVKALGITEGSLDEELAALKAGTRTAVIDVPDELFTGETKKLTVFLNRGRPIESQIAMSIINQFADRATQAITHTPPLFTVDPQPVDSHNTRYIDFLLPGVMAMAIMQMSVFSVAFVFARYREQGILKRLVATPMRPSQFVTANILTRLAMSVVQAGLFVFCGVFFFHASVSGAYWLLAVSVVLGALMFLGLGFTISGFAKTVETVPVLANIVVFPMLFMGNVFFPVTGMPPWLRAIADYLPLTYFSGALRGVMTEGAGPVEIQRDLIGMGIWCVVLITLAILTFRFQEKEG